MHDRNHKSRQTVRLVLVYLSMVSLIIVTVVLAMFFLMGYRLDFNSGSVKQRALLQFDSSPSGAIVQVDDNTVLSKTPNKAMVSSGIHEVSISRDGYKTWHKLISVEAGSVSWLNYAILVPSEPKIEISEQYDSLYKSLAAPNKKAILVQKQVDKPTFEFIDISGNKVKTTSLTIPMNSYSQSEQSDVSHTFQATGWDKNSRFVLIRHTNGQNLEWLLLDIQNPSATINISTLLGITIDDIVFDGTDGNKFYILSVGTIRSINLKDETISRVLVNNVDSFQYGDRASALTYVGKTDSRDALIVGSYRPNDSSPVILARFSDLSTSIKIATVNYDDIDYLAIATNQEVSFMKGVFPTAINSSSDSFKTAVTLEVKHEVNSLDFSPNDKYLLIQSGSYFATYDLEYKVLNRSAVAVGNFGVGLGWLARGYLWSINDSKLTIRQFDGTNVHELGSALVGYDAVMTEDLRYIYSFCQTNEGFQLQRIKMII